MSNDVRIQVHWDDPDGAKFQASQKEKARKAGSAAGDEFAKVTRAKVKKAGSDAATDFEGSFSGNLSQKAIAAAQKAGGDSGNAFGEKLIASSKRGTQKATSAIEKELAGSQEKIAEVGKEIGGELGDGIENGAKAGAQRGGEAVDSELSRVAGRANKAFDAKMFTGLSVGLPAAAAAGAVGAAGALALPGVAVVAVAGLILRNNEKVSGSFNGLANDVIADSDRMAQVMVGPLVGAASDLHDSWDRLRPVAEEAFKAGAPEVKVLTGAVTDLAEGALPGMVTGLKASHPALIGVRVLAGEAGKGLGEFFANASQGAAGAGQGTTIFAGTLRMVEARAGTLFAQLANGSAGPLTQFHVILDQGTAALLDLTSEGSAAISFLSGFGSAAGGTITVLRGVVALLDTLPAGVAQYGGSLAAASMISQKFGLDMGAQFQGVGAKVRAAGNDLAGIEKGAAKAGTAVGALAAGALSPTTLAVAGLAAGLMILGQRQQDNAADAQAHAARERDLAGALRESKGAVTESVRAKAADTLANYKLHDGTRNLLTDTQKLAGDSGVKLLTDGYLGNADASKKLVDQLRQVTAEHTHMAGGVEALTTNFERLGTGAGGSITAMDDTGFAAKQLADIVEQSGGDFEKAKASLAALGLASQGGAKALTSMEAAMEGLKDSASGSEERLSALVDVMNILEGRNATFEEAIQSGNDALRSMEESLGKGVEKADGFGKSLLNADGSLNTFTANGSQLQDLATGLETSFGQAGTAIDGMVRQGMPFDQAVKKVNDGLLTQRDRFVQVAEKMGLSAAEAQHLADKYGLIPQSITTFVTADTKQGQDAIAALPAFAANTHGAVSVTADVNPVTNKISTVVEYADGSTGVITIDGQRNPVNGQIEAAVQYANGAKGFMTIDGFIQAAKDRTLEAKRNADGTISWIIVDANTGRANSAIDNAARPRTAIITGVYIAPSISGLGAAANRKAKGGMVGYASGGEVRSVPKLAGGGQRAIDVTPGGVMRGQGTGTSDSILAMSSNGPFAGSNGEFVIRASQTRKWRPLLEDINAGVNGFADGGMVQYGSVSQSKWDGLLASGWRGNPNDGMEALYAPTQGRYGSGSTAAPVQVVVSFDGIGGGVLDRVVMDWLRSRIRIEGGGNVQAALGRG